MHNNYFFLQKLSPFIERLVSGFTISACFSQERDELILESQSKYESFYIKFTLKPHQTFLSFPNNFARAKNNSMDLFSEIIGETILKVTCVTNDRALKIELTNGKLLFVRLYGSQGNIILFQNNKYVKMFNKKHNADQEIIPQLTDKDFIIDVTSYEKHLGDITKVVPTIGNMATVYWNQNFHNQNFDSLLMYLMQLQQTKEFYIIKYHDKIALTLFPLGEIHYKTTNPIEACNLLYSTYISSYQLNKEKNALISNLQSQMSKTERYIKKSSERLSFLENEARNEEMGHILMANLHQIPLKVTDIILDDFYTNKPIKIVLKKDLNPQQNAEYYYKKAKNEWKEKATIKENIKAREEKIVGLKQLIEEVQLEDSIKIIRSLTKPNAKTQKSEPTVDELFRKINIDNYTVLIGKNSANNDLLTLKYATKDDLWLHARNVSGSHVIIKNIPGQKIPLYVIERAAEIAAYHSKAKNESLSPVMYTPKKFVRKIKGSAPGSVVVSKEEVILVVPRNYE